MTLIREHPLTVMLLVLMTIALFACPDIGGDPGHQTTGECSRQGQPAYQTPQGQRCYDK